MRHVRVVLALLAVLGGVFLLLKFGAEFSSRQSAFLAVLLLVAYGVFGTGRGESTRDRVLKSPEANWGEIASCFTPHELHISPKWPELLKNYKLLADKDQQEFREEWDVGSPVISFAVLQCKWGAFEPALIHWDQGNCFVTEVDFSQPIPKFGLDPYFNETKSAISPQLHIRREFYFQGKLPSMYTEEDRLEFDRQAGAAGGRWERIEGYEGYEMSLMVDRLWWERISSSGGVKDPPLEVETSVAEGKAKIVLAIFPFLALLHYYDPYGIIRYGSAEKYRQTSEIRLKQNGWLQQESGGSVCRCLEHKYFTVNHLAI